MADEPEKCTVCTESMLPAEDEARLILKLKCGHCFHTHCAAERLVQHKNCPNCRDGPGVQQVVTEDSTVSTVSDPSAKLSYTIELSGPLSLIYYTLAAFTAIPAGIYFIRLLSRQ